MANPALIDELEKQFRDNPRRVFARLANEYRKGGDFMRAIEICHAHVPQQPGYISGHIVLGQALYDAGELDQAQQTFQTALSLDPENLIALRQLGDIARNRRDYREARSWYTRLLEVDPQNDEIVAQLGEIALAEGETSGADVDVPAAASQAEEQETGLATATAVDDSEGNRSPESISLGAEHEIDDALDALSHNDVSSRFGTAEQESDEASSGPSGFTDIQERDAERTPELTIDEGELFPEEHVIASEEHRPSMPDDHDDDDVAWIAAESDTIESVEFTVSEADQANTTEFVVAEAGKDDDQSIAPPTDDFDFVFEREELEELPLRPHTGESLSIIAEEDALAGVQPTRQFDRSPFGDPIDAAATRESDTPDASFEPLPVEDIDAASEVAQVEDLGGEDLLEEMARWSSPEPDADEPADVDEARAAPDDAHADIFIDSEAETIIEETVIAESIIDESRVPEPAMDGDWDAAPAEPEPPIEPRTPAEPSVPDARLESAPEPERDAEAESSVSESLDESAEEAMPAAFVTGTMAELYLQQGFRNEALDVYRKLAAQSPDDAGLRDRISELEQRAGPTPEAPGESVPGMRRSASAFFKSLASVEPPPPPQPVEPASSNGHQLDDLLSGAGEVNDQDDAAATALSNGFHPPAESEPRGSATRAADRRLSLQDIFGAGEQSDRGTAAGSLDAFFTPEGERLSSGQSDEEGREDLEAFNAWLEGLKK